MAIVTLLSKPWTLSVAGYEIWTEKFTGVMQLNFTQQRAVCQQLLCEAAASRYLHLHVPVSGDILRLSWKDVILSAAGVSAAAKDTGGVGGTRPRFCKEQWWAWLKFQQIYEKETSWQHDTYRVQYQVSTHRRITYFGSIVILILYLWFMFQLVKANWSMYCLEKLQLI